ncbi:MAG: carbamoyltransferase HypF [Thermodesulfobacteriota bacterium]
MRNGKVETGTAQSLEIKGIVQGVGFRPFIYQLATGYGLNGTVANTATGVEIHIEGNAGAIAAFVDDIETQAPPLAHITDIVQRPAAPLNCSGFSIRHSRAGGRRTTLISPDVSICNDCLAELFDPADRRFGYPFINCTNCGPRYTIVDDIPYDRPNTSMKHFPMCPRCQAEYDDPGSRRFHAQPNACPACGPHEGLFDNHGKDVGAAEPIAHAGRLLQNGYILAVKGLGGFHLAVDAQNRDAVHRLRAGKHRAEKPFALMAENLSAIEGFARITAEEKALLQSVQRPIVLLQKRHPNAIAENVCPENRYFGVMLPYTPLHYLLFFHGCKMLVMTSGNVSEEPIAIDNTEAIKNLSGIADYFLVHNRDIYLRSDDSIVRHTAGAKRFLRRSRGYVPTPVFLDHSPPNILACGAELKNTVCLTKGAHAFVSQHIGDLENRKALDFFRHTIAHMQRILAIEPAYIAHDMHPGYLSTQYAEKQTRFPRIAVQHHHAHIVSCMAENHIDGKVIGLALDGTGYGTDGTIWGGEALVASAEQFQRAAHLSCVAMPGGAAAIKAPWRMGLSYLLDAFGDTFRELDLPFLSEIDAGDLDIVCEMVAKEINSPLTSSLGRLFDGVAAIVGISNHVDFEGQAAMALEMHAEDTIDALQRSMCYDYEIMATQPIQIPVKPMIRSVVDDQKQGASVSQMATRFHVTLIYLFADLCEQLRKQSGINRVALSGGVFQNALLLNGLSDQLASRGFAVFTNRQVPANDGGICLGQAMVAAAKVKNDPLLTQPFET